MKSFKQFGITKSKYNAVRTEVDGIKFDSKAEAECYQILKLMERNGQIKLIEIQPKVYMTLARILYKPDFKIDEGGKIVFIDVKGKQTTAFNLKLRLWQHYGEGTLRLIRLDQFGFSTVKQVTSTGGTDDNKL